MATTTNYGWTTPDDTSLVKDGAAAIRTLGSSVDTTTKALNPSTTLGDIEYRSATANTNTRLGVGTTGQVLTVAGGVPSWATPAVSASGLTLITTQSFTTSSGVNINDIFSTTYDHYKLVFSLTASTSASLNGRLRVAGADNTNSTYDTQRLTASNATVSAARVTAQTSFEITDYNGQQFVVAAEIYNPFASLRTNVIWQSTVESPPSYWVRSGYFTATTSFTGLTVYPSSGTISGSVSVWGFSK